jgi:hypothetical protein
MLAGLRRSYSVSLHQRPLLTKSATGAAIMAAADCLQQQMEHRQQHHMHSAPPSPPEQEQPPPQQQQQQQQQAFSWDAQRAARLVGFYGAFQMPFVHYWFAFLERSFGPVSPLANGPRFLAKVVTDQSFGLPFVMGCFCFVQPQLQGLGLEAGVDKVRRDWQVMCVAGWKVWFPTNLVVFALVPLHYRPLAMNFVSLGWSMYVSRMN